MKSTFVALLLVLLISNVGASDNFEVNKTSPADSTVIVVDLRADSKCMFGDLDVLLLDLAESKGTLALQMTLESLPLSSEEFFVGEPVAPNEKKDASGLGSYRFTIPKSKMTDAFMATLCTISNKKGENQRCSKQELVSINDSSKRFRVKSDDKLNKTSYLLEENLPLPVPKMFFSQLLFVGINQELKTSENEVEIDLIKNLMGEVGKTNDRSKEIFQDFKKIDEVLQSQPLINNGQKLQVPLAFYDSKRCNGR